MGKALQLTDKKFGKWTVLYRVKSRNNIAYWLCLCDCGLKKEVSGRSLKSGASKQCTKCRPRKSFITHSYCRGVKPKEYYIWNGIKERCLNPKNKGYKNYGGRGIEICESWKNSFENFINDMGPKPLDDYSIERINVNGHYEKENCEWIPRSEQNKNTRKQRFGINISQWCKENNKDRFHVTALLEKKIPLEEIKKIVTKECKY